MGKNGQTIGKLQHHSVRKNGLTVGKKKGSVLKGHLS